MLKTTDNQENKQEQLLATIKTIEKIFGKGAIMTFNNHQQTEVEVTSSGSILLNLALGINGFPKGRVIEIFGPEATGKTTLALMALAEVQKTSSLNKIAFIDAEHALDANYCQRIGINLDEFILSQPDSGEQALEILELLIKSQSIDMVVVDSVAALVPLAELSGDINDQVMGAQARLMSKGLRRLAPLISKSNCTVIFINQVRQKIGVIYGNPEVTPGGKALCFYSSIRLDVRKGEQIVQNQEIIGHKIKVKVVKNKLASPYKVAILDFYFAYGVSAINEIIELALVRGIIKRSGSWLSYEDQNLAQGKEKTREQIEKNPEMLEKIKLQLGI